MTKPWSKLKSRVESLWDPALPLTIHCTAYANSADRKGESRFSRHWLVLKKAVIWDFPGQFVSEEPACGVRFAAGAPGWHFGGSIIGVLLRDYIDRSPAALFDPFPEDGWELTDLLRAADRRLGKKVLSEWARTLRADHPAHRVLETRFSP